MAIELLDGSVDAGLVAASGREAKGVNVVWSFDMADLAASQDFIIDMLPFIDRNWTALLVGENMTGSGNLGGSFRAVGRVDRANALANVRVGSEVEPFSGQLFAFSNISGSGGRSGGVSNRSTKQHLRYASARITKDAGITGGNGFLVIAA